MQSVGSARRETGYEAGLRYARFNMQSVSARLSFEMLSVRFEMFNYHV